ncbi:MAG: GNAT family N-acetyltransferase [Chitinophagaceae bacterium]|nr:GNAT family N-acetyltransferase [Chitinophagaceae bacterium]
MIILKRTTSEDKSFYELTEFLDKELRNRYGSTQEEFDQFNMMINLDTVVIAYENNKAIGCGCFKVIEDDTVELKRMFVEAAHRGKGIAVAIIKELEVWAGEIGFSSIVLETGTLQPEAIQLYHKQGYHIIPNYGPFIGNELSVCMKKSLVNSK